MIGVTDCVGDWWGGARLGLQTVLQAAMKAPSGVPANESADLFMNRWVF